MCIRDRGSGEPAVRLLQRAHMLLASLVSLADLAVGEEKRTKAGEGKGGDAKAKAKANALPADDDEEEGAGLGGEDGDDDEPMNASAEEAASRRVAVEQALQQVREAGLDEAMWNELRGLALAAAAGKGNGACCSPEWRKLVPKLRSLTELSLIHI